MYVEYRQKQYLGHNTKIFLSSSQKAKNEENRREYGTSANITINYDEREFISVADHGGTQGCETSRLPNFLDNWLIDGAWFFNLTPLLSFLTPPPGRFLVLISLTG
jgi:hypothetical protein